MVSGKRDSRLWSRFRPAALAAGALTLCVIVPAIAQVPPPSRRDDDSNTGGKVPHYVDSADYDRQPYYVDGVEYKPYTPDKKKAKPAADTVKTPPAQASAPQTPAYVSPAPTSETELHPFSASSAAARSASASKSASASTSVATTAAPGSQAPANTTSVAPLKRPRYAVAIIEALDKISSESVRFEAPIGQPVRYKGLIYTVKACETTADDEPMSDVIAYMQVRTNPVATANNAPPSKSKEIFHGWTYASTPSLNPLQHPIYDAWVIGCRKPLPGKAG